MRTAQWSDAVSVLDRLNAILEAIGDDDRGVGITEISRRAQLPKSTVSRLAADLVRQRCLDRVGDRFFLGLRLFEYGQAVPVPRALRHLALPVMMDLRDRLGADVRLLVPDGADLVTIAAVPAVGRAADPSAVGRRTRAGSTAAGSVLADDRVSGAPAAASASAAAGTTEVAVAVRSRGGVLGAIVVTVEGDARAVAVATELLREGATSLHQRLARGSAPAGLDG